MVDLQILNICLCILHTVYMYMTDPRWLQLNINHYLRKIFPHVKSSFSVSLFFFLFFPPSSPLVIAQVKFVGTPQHIESVIPLCFAGWEEMRYVGWEGLMVALSRCFQTDVHGEDYSSGNNEFSMQGNWSDCMVLWGVTTTNITFLNPDFSEFSGLSCVPFLSLSLKR